VTCIAFRFGVNVFTAGDDAPHYFDYREVVDIGFFERTIVARHRYSVVVRADGIERAQTSVRLVYIDGDISHGFVQMIAAAICGGLLND